MKPEHSEKTKRYCRQCFSFLFWAGFGEPAWDVVMDEEESKAGIGFWGRASFYATHYRIK